MISDCSAAPVESITEPIRTLVRIPSRASIEPVYHDYRDALRRLHGRG